MYFPEVRDENGKEIISTKFLMDGARKVVASPNQIGIWSVSDDKGAQVTLPLELEHLKLILKNGGKCNLDWFDGKWFTESEYSSEPLIHDNKVIISI